MADAGNRRHPDQLQPDGDEKMARLGRLQAKANITVAADNFVVIAVTEAAAASAARSRSWSSAIPGRSAPAWETPAEAIALAREIAAFEGLTFGGFMRNRPRPAGPRHRNFFR